MEETGRHGAERLWLRRAREMRQNQWYEAIRNAYRYRHWYYSIVQQ